MGCGKSSVGRRLAALTGHRFVDTDDLVVQAEGRSISEIFASEGEGYFRQVEKGSIQGLVGVCGIVLSTGGGIILDPDNREILRKIGMVAWLDAEKDVLFQRAIRSGRRPLLQTDNPREKFDSLLSMRVPLYEEVSDFRIDSSVLDHDQAASAILEGALRHPRRFDC